jgi:hypothetical protein
MSELAFSIIVTGRLASQSRAPLAFTKKMILDTDGDGRMLKVTAGRDIEYPLKGQYRCRPLPQDGTSGPRGCGWARAQNTIIMVIQIT